MLPGVSRDVDISQKCRIGVRNVGSRVKRARLGGGFTPAAERSSVKFLAEHEDANQLCASSRNISAFGSLARTLELGPAGVRWAA